MRRTQRIVGLATLLFVATVAAPLGAGNLYIPIIDGVIPGKTSTQIYLSNTGEAGRGFTPTFIPRAVPGTNRVEGQRVELAPGTTFGATSQDLALTEIGLLELDAAPQINADAQLLVDLGQRLVSLPLPVISSVNALFPDGLAQLLGLARDGDLDTDVFVVNLSSQSMQCSAGLFHADGRDFGQRAVTVPPLTMAHFSRVLINVFGLGAGEGLRLDVRCDQTFFAFAALVDVSAVDIALIQPAASGNSTLGGDDDGPPPPPVGGQVLYEEAAPYVVTQGSPVRIINITVPSGSWRSMILDVDIAVGPWYSRDPGAYHQLIWWYDEGKLKTGTLAQVGILGGNNPKLRALQTMGGFTPAQSSPASLGPGDRVHMRIVYDTGPGRFSVEITRGGQRVSYQERPATVSTLIHDWQKLHLGQRNLGGFEKPIYGWTFSNLRITGQR